MKGQVFKIWKQAPNIFCRFEKIFLPHLEEREAKESFCEKNGVFVYEIQDSKIVVYTVFPRNAEINLKGFNIPYPKNNNEGLIANVIHSYSTVRVTLNTYLRALQRLFPDKINETSPTNWWEFFQWKERQAQLQVKINGQGENAKYDLDPGEIAQITIGEEKVSPTPSKSKADKIGVGLSCRNFDILSHEVGHAILDSLSPNLSEFEDLHEAFADLATMFSLLSMMDICDRLVVMTENNLRSDNFLMHFGEQVQRQRDRSLTVTYNRIYNDRSASAPTGKDLYADSMKISIPIYNCIVDAFEVHQQIIMYDPAESLFRVGRHILDIFLYAVCTIDARKYRRDKKQHLKEKMLEYVQLYHAPFDNNYREDLRKIIEKNFSDETLSTQ